jgi:hypothetical protein
MKFSTSLGWGWLPFLFFFLLKFGQVGAILRTNCISKTYNFWVGYLIKKKLLSWIKIIFVYINLSDKLLIFLNWPKRYLILIFYYQIKIFCPNSIINISSIEQHSNINFFCRQPSYVFFNSKLVTYVPFSLGLG